MSALLTAADGPAFRTLGDVRASPVVLLCDHAGNRVPEKLDNLGLAADDLQRHFAVDVGAGALTERLAALIGCAAVLCNFSRLVIDCNRRPDQPSAMTLEEDGFAIPGNRNLVAAERQARVDAIFTPYHQAVERTIAEAEAKHGRVCIVGVHSFTPQYRAMPLPRPWHIGVLWHHDPATALALLTYLRNNTDLEIGDNEPYAMRPKDGKSVTYTLEHHAEKPNRPGLQLEVRNDEIVTARGVERYAQIFAGFFRNWS